MTIARRLLIAVLTALVLALPTVPATSAQAAGHGWWWRGQTGLLGVELPPPPDVPADGLHVERGPDGPSAIAAVRFALGQGETDPVLTLRIAAEQGADAAAIAACVATTQWEPTQGGRWDGVPGHDCDAGSAPGVRADDGTAWTWRLTDLVRPDGTIDIVLVDTATAPFRTSLHAPTDTSLTVTAPVATGAPAQDAPADPLPPVTAGPAPFVPEVPAPPPAAPVVPEPEVAAPAAVPAPTPQATSPTLAAGTTGRRDVSWATYVLMTMIGALVAVDLWATARNRAVTGRSADRAVTGRSADRGGIGRFDRPRTEPPAPLW